MKSMHEICFKTLEVCKFEVMVGKRKRTTAD